MTETRYRIQSRKAGRVAGEVLISDWTLAKTTFELLRRANIDANANGEGYDNIELQVRLGGEARFQPVLQAVGAALIEW